MKVIKFTILPFLIYCQVSLAEVIPSLIVSGECVEDVEIVRSEISADWYLVIKLNDSVKKEMLEFSRNNIGNEVRLALGVDGDYLIENNIIIRAEYATKIQLSGILSKEEAAESKRKLLSSMGKCGYK